jgi:hypothetical protein
MTMRDDDPIVDGGRYAPEAHDVRAQGMRPPMSAAEADAAYGRTRIDPPLPTTRVADVNRRWRGDRVRWGAVWAGLLVTVSGYIVLQLTLVATGLIEIGNAESSDAWWSAGAALVAFFIGGVTTGASAMWDRVSDGVLHGVVMWALAAVGILVLSVAASGLALGALDSGGLFDEAGASIEEALDDAGDDVSGAEAEEAASWVLLGLGAAVVAAVIGGSVGAKLWDGRDDDVDALIDHRDRYDRV